VPKMYEYLIGNLFFVAFWFILYFIRKDLRKEMIFASLLCMPLGLSEVFFIPHYWNPHRLFNLNPAIESLLFCFTVGGIAAVLYEVVLKKHLKKAREKRIKTKRHFYALAGVLIFSLISFSFIFKMDLIYTAIIAMALGAVAIMLSRKDLIKETIFSSKVLKKTLLLQLDMLKSEHRETLNFFFSFYTKKHLSER